MNIVNFVTLRYKGSNSVPPSLAIFLDDHTKTSYTTGLPLSVIFDHKHRIAREIEK